MEVGHVAGEALPVLRVVLVGVAEKVGRIGDVRQAAFDLGRGLLGASKQEGGAARRCGVFQRIPRPRLRRVHSNRQRVGSHTRPHVGDGGLHGLGAGLAGKLHVGGADERGQPQNLGDDGGGGLDGVRLRFASHPHGPDLAGRDVHPAERILRRLDAHRGRVFIRSGNRLGANGHAALLTAPAGGDGLSTHTPTRHVGAVTGDPHRVLGPHQSSLSRHGT